jgi:hypothetical protein
VQTREKNFVDDTREKKEKKTRTASKTEIPVDSSAQVTFSNESLLQNPAINSLRVGHLITSGLLKSTRKISEYQASRSK